MLGSVVHSPVGASPPRPGRTLAPTGPELRSVEFRPFCAPCFHRSSPLLGQSGGPKIGQVAERRVVMWQMRVLKEHELGVSVEFDRDNGYYYVPSVEE